MESEEGSDTKPSRAHRSAAAQGNTTSNDAFSFLTAKFNYDERIKNPFVAFSGIYDFRRVNRAVPWQTYIDNDKSGDFDPSPKRPPRKNKAAKTENKKRQHSSRNSASEEGAESQQPPKMKTWQSGRRQGVRSHLVLKIGAEAWKTDRGIALAAALKGEPDNWPDRVVKRAASDENFTELSLDSIQTGRLRKRQKILPKNMQDSVTAASNADLMQGLTLGHPAARGCRACFELDHVCSLIEGSKWPCQHCEVEKEDCELIMEPEKKRACTKCTSRRVICSFRSTTEHHGDCKQCRIKGYKCIAGPQTARTRRGPPTKQAKKSSDGASKPSTTENKHQPEEADIETNLVSIHGGSGAEAPKEHSAPPKARKLISESESHNWRRTRPRAHTNLIDPVESYDGVINAFMAAESIHRNDSRGQALAWSRIDRVTDKPIQGGRFISNPFGLANAVRDCNGWIEVPDYAESLGLVELAMRTGDWSNTEHPNVWATSFILTNYVHPIHFNYESKEEELVWCHWCDDITYGLFGYRQRRVEVINRGRDGYHEVEGGWVHEGHVASRMCVKCTTLRFEIIGCSRHALGIIEGMAEMVLTEDDIKSSQAPGLASDTPFQWCSLCPWPAYYACMARETRAGGDQDQEQAGCGLVLCEDCASDLMADPNRCLSTLIATRQHNIDRKIPLRTDAHFLSKVGHLLVRSATA